MHLRGCSSVTLTSDVPALCLEVLLDWYFDEAEYADG